ncbi:HEPN domain-containing protein [bacterium]|nr:HEPN domain-containing protein [bacterium]
MDNNLVKLWLKTSRQNLQIAKMIFSQKDEDLYKFVGFHCHMSAKKAMKAYLTHHKVKFGRIHDLQVLGDEVVKISPSVKGLMIRAVSLTPYAVEFRYPESADKPVTTDQINSAIGLAEFILQGMIDLMEKNLKS